MHCNVRYLLDFDLKIRSGQVCPLHPGANPGDSKKYGRSKPAKNSAKIVGSDLYSKNKNERGHEHSTGRGRGLSTRDDIPPPQWD